MLNKYLTYLLLEFTIILFAHQCVAAESIQNETKIRQFKNVTDKIYKDYLKYGLKAQQYVVVIHNDFTLSYANRDRLLKDLYGKILDNYKEVFAIAYMNFPDSLDLRFMNLGFIIINKDFCPIINSEINKLKIPKIHLSHADDLENFITALNEKNTTIFVPEMRSEIVEDDSILYTTKVNDCVAVTFQGTSKKTGKNAAQLAHYYRKQSIEEFLKASLDHFNPSYTQVNIVSNCYSPHLLDLINYLREKGFKINGLYVPEIEASFMENKDGLCLVFCHPIAMFDICKQSLIVVLRQDKLYFNYKEIIAEQIRQHRSYLNNISSKEIIFGVAVLAGLYYFLF